MKFKDLSLLEKIELKRYIKEAVEELSEDDIYTLEKKTNKVIL